MVLSVCLVWIFPGDVNSVKLVALEKVQALLSEILPGLLCVADVVEHGCAHDPAQGSSPHRSNHLQVWVGEFQSDQNAVHI